MPSKHHRTQENQLLDFLFHHDALLGGVDVIAPVLGWLLLFFIVVLVLLLVIPK